MPEFHLATPPAASYALIPSMPTPNGRLHLGHIAGPFLRLDIAARYLRSRGHRTVIITGTDPYESHVILQAGREGCSPRDIATRYTRGMRRDLHAFDIECELIDPLTDEFGALYQRYHLAALERLHRAGVAVYREARFPYADGAFLPRSYLAGACPSCGSGIAGSVCEECGRQFIPEQVVDPHLRPGLPAAARPSAMDWRATKTLVMQLRRDDPRLEAIVAEIERLALPPRYAQIALRHIREWGGAMELTLPDTGHTPWGLVWPAPGAARQVVFNYATPYAWSHALGELAAVRLGARQNAMAVDSDIITVGSYGVDITVCWIAITVALSALDTLATPRYRPFEHFWGNEFLRLHGSKFSTSRGHVIWGGEFMERTPVGADMARYHLATIDPRHSETDFRVDDLVNTVNEILLGEIYAAADAGCRQLRPERQQHPSTEMRQRLYELVARQDAHFDMRHTNGPQIDEAAALIRDWAQDRHRGGDGVSERASSDRYWFLKGLALVCAPIMPNFADALWHRLGAPGQPNIWDFGYATVPRPGAFDPPCSRLYHSSLQPCLPATLDDDTAKTTEASAAEASASGRDDDSGAMTNAALAQPSATRSRSHV